LRRRQGWQRPATRVICLVAQARAATAGDAGDLPCGAGKGGNGRRRRRFLTCGEGDNGRRRGRFALRRRQGWQRPATRAICLAALARAATAGDAGDLPCGAGKGGNGRRLGRFAWRRRQGRHWPATRAGRLAARLTTAVGAGDSPYGAGKGGNGRRRGRFALRRGRRGPALACDAGASSCGAGVEGRQHGQGRQRPAARRLWLTPLRVTDPMSFGPPSRRCMFASASRLVLRVRWPDRDGRWDPRHC